MTNDEIKAQAIADVGNALLGKKGSRYLAWIERVTTKQLCAEERAVAYAVAQREQNIRLELERKWTRVQEGMPPDRKAVLVWCPERKNKYTAVWRVPYWEFFGSHGEVIDETVTHWMPTPAGPCHKRSFFRAEEKQ